MARNVKYRATFKNIHNQTCIINFYVEGYSGTVINLTPAANPFTFSETNNTDTTGVPIRTQSGYVRIIDNGDCAELVAYSAFDIQIKYIVAGTIRWVGYVKPQQFSQDWEPTPRELEIPVISPLGLLDTCKTKIAATAFPNVAAILLDALNQVYDGYTDFYICDRKPAGAYEYISDQWATNTLMSVRADNTQSEVELDDSTRDHKPEEYDAIFDRKDCRTIIEDLCNYYDWTLRECGTSIILDYANNHIIRLFTAEQFSNIASKASEETVGLPIIHEHGAFQPQQIFEGYDSGKNSKSLSKGYKWANKNMAANVKNTYQPQWKDITEVGNTYNLECKYDNNTKLTRILHYAVAQDKDLHFSADSYKGNITDDNQPIIYEDYLKSDAEKKSVDVVGGTAYYYIKHDYAMTNAYRVGAVAKGGHSNSVTFNSLLPHAIAYDGVNMNFAINIQATAKAKISAMTEDEEDEIRRWAIIPRVGSYITILVQMGEYYLPMYLTLDAHVVTEPWTKENTKGGSAYVTPTWLRVGLGEKNPISYDINTGDAVIRNISTLNEGTKYHVTSGLTLPLPAHPANKYYNKAQPIYGPIKIIFHTAGIFTNYSTHVESSDDSILLEDLRIQICSNKTLQDSKTVRMLTSVGKNYQDELDVSTGDFITRDDVGPFQYSYTKNLKISNQADYDDNLKESALYSQQVLTIHVEEKRQNYQVQYSYTWNDKSYTAVTTQYYPSDCLPINSIIIDDCYYNIIACQYDAINCRYKLTIKQVTTPITSK